VITFARYSWYMTIKMEPMHHSVTCRNREDYSEGQIQLTERKFMYEQQLPRLLVAGSDPDIF
jgi:hypothetical protein